MLVSAESKLVGTKQPHVADITRGDITETKYRLMNANMHDFAELLEVFIEGEKLTELRRRMAEAPNRHTVAVNVMIEKVRHR